MSYLVPRRSMLRARNSIVSTLFVFTALVSTSAHAVWEKVSGFTAPSATAVAVNPNDPQKIYAGSDGGSTTFGAGLYVSSNGGLSWTQVTTATSTTFGSQVVTLANKSVSDIAVGTSTTGFNSTVYAAFIEEGLFKSVDGGFTWTAMPLTVNGNIIKRVNFQIVPARSNFGGLSKLYVVVGNNVFANEAGIYVSNDDGLSWQQVYWSQSQNTIKKLVVDPNNSETLYMTTTNGELLKSLDGGRTFQSAGSGLQVGFGATIVDFIVDPNNANNLYASVVGSGISTASGTYSSTNGGLSWTRSNSNQIFSMLAASRSLTTGLSKLYGVSVSTFSSTVYSSADNGLSWIQVDPASATLTGSFAHEIAVVNDVIYLATHNGLYKNGFTTGGGLNAPLAISSTLNVPVGQTSVQGQFQAQPVTQGDILSYQIVSQPTRGTVTQTGGTSSPYFTYTSTFGSTSGTDLVSFRVIDSLGRQSQTATVTISFGGTIGGGTAPVATNTTLNVPTGQTSVQGQFQAQPVNFGDILTYQIVTQPTRGTVTQTGGTSSPYFTYTSTFGSTSGTDSVAFRVIDNQGRQSQTAYVTISFGGTIGGGTAPVATSSTLNVPLGQTTVQGQFQATGVNFSDILTYQIVTQPTRGTVTQTSGTQSPFFTYTNTSGLTSGTDSISFRVTDNQGRSSQTAFVSITFGGSGGVITGMDVRLTGTATPSTVQVGSTVTINLSLQNLSTTQTASGVTITSTALPEGLTQATGSSPLCTYNIASHIWSCNVGNLTLQETRNIPIVMQVQSTFFGTSINATFTANAIGDTNTANNTAQIFTSVGTGTGGIGGTVPTALTSIVNVLSGQPSATGSLNATKVSTLDQLTYIIVTPPQKGNLAFTNTSTGTVNSNTNSSFIYTPYAGSTGTDFAQFKVRDQLGRESAIATININIQGVAAGATASASKSGGGGAFHPVMLLGFLLLLVGRIRKQ